MAGMETQISPGETWLALEASGQVNFLEGIIQGLNQGLRHCAGDIAFSLATRMPDVASPENKLAIGSLIQQTRTWSKLGVTVFKYSKPMQDYAECITTFYTSYPQYRNLTPAYL